ncbi:TPA: hypothetical protein ROY17_005581 [Bacillus thuringiensis]|nr:hypothetical protein [Bacillus thuringiensis]
MSPLKNLGTLPGGKNSRAFGINNFNQVVGYSEVRSGAVHAFVWEDNIMKDLGTLPGGKNSKAFAINDLKQIVGISETTRGTIHAVLWENDVIKDLGALHIKGNSQAYGINLQGEIVGMSETHINVKHATLWKRNKAIDLNPSGETKENSIFLSPSVKNESCIQQKNTSDYEKSYAFGINNFNQIVGCKQVDYGVLHPTVWNHKKQRLLPILAPGKQNKAYSLNNHPKKLQVVGISQTKQGNHHAVFWHNFHLIDLGTLGGKNSQAIAINDVFPSPTIVGFSQTPDGATHAFIWKSGQMVDIGTLGGLQSKAYDVNFRGIVVGAAETDRGAIHAFLYDSW